jgi:hypothetical protein
VDGGVHAPSRHAKATAEVVAMSTIEQRRDRLIAGSAVIGAVTVAAYIVFMG